ncbi:MAG: hypothetical protein K9G58_06050 [Bacteroidales bacterium]|nr:hypothetical protein [Bacteroidales bacterium]MCF8397709.1 hypothetical protein [Bacteroidales bacterium]
MVRPKYSSCRNSINKDTEGKSDEKDSAAKLQAMIDENEAKKLFLDFYSGMNEKTFLLVKEKLIKEKKLNDIGRYNLTYYIPDYDLYRNLTLKIVGVFDDRGELDRLILQDKDFDPITIQIKNGSNYIYIPPTGDIDIESLVNIFKLKYGEFEHPSRKGFGELEKDTNSYMFFYGAKKVILSYYPGSNSNSYYSQDYNQVEPKSLSIEYIFEDKKTYHKKVKERYEKRKDSIINLKVKYEKKMKESIKDI